MPAHDLDRIGNEYYRVEFAEVLVKRRLFAVHAQDLRIRLDGDLKLVAYLFRLANAAADDRKLFSEPNRLLRLCSLEGFCGRKEMDGFEPIGLPPTVIPNKDVQPARGRE